MILPDWKPLVGLTVTKPYEAAAQLLALQLATPVLWMVLGLTIVLNAITHGLIMMMLPAAAEAPALFAHPLLFAMSLGGAEVIGIFILTWVGQALGGKAQLADMLVLMTWLQMLRVGLQVIVFLLVFISPSLGDMLSMVAGLYGIWITAAFLDAAQQFGSIFKAFGVLLLSFFGAAFGLAIFLLLIGANPVGMP